MKSGLGVWLSLRWYPILLEMYCAGIAAVAARRYDSLASLFYTRMPGLEGNKEQYFVESVTDAIIEWNRANIFKRIPGHDRYFTPQSEYLFKRLQPSLDDTLFLGKSYESAFDEFEILLALVVADIEKQKGSGHWSVWGSIGRFGWKHRKLDSAGPFAALLQSARSEGENWAPLEAGLFGGSSERALEVATGVAETVSKLNWY